MKSVVFFLAVLSTANTCINAQNNEKFTLSLQAGVKYTPFEYLGGPLIGLYFHDKTDRFSLGLRKDFILAVGKTDITSRSYAVMRYHTYDYFDFGINFKKKLRAGAGLGWIYDGNGENIKLFDNGYLCSSVFIQYKITKIYAEIRGDIPLEKYRPEIDQGHLFPVSLALVYSFTPLK